MELLTAQIQNVEGLSRWVGNFVSKGMVLPEGYADMFARLMQEGKMNASTGVPVARQLAEAISKLPEDDRGRQLTINYGFALVVLKTCGVDLRDVRI